MVQRRPPRQSDSDQQPPDPRRVRLLVQSREFPVSLAAWKSIAWLDCLQPRSVLRNLLADGTADLRRCPNFESIRRSSRKQFVKDHSERVDVACRCNRLTAYLLWARVLRIHDRLINRGRYSLDTGFFRIVKSSLQIDPLGDAKINELGHAIRGNQDVGWLQISVNHRADAESERPRKPES